MKIIKKIADKIKLSLPLVIAFITVYATPVFAVDAANPLLESAPVQGLLRFLKDATTVLMIASPIICGILIGLFSIISGTQSEPQDKEKWNKNRKTTIFALCWVFGASAVVSLITAYFK